MSESGNLFADIPDSIPDEIFETLLKSSTVKIERILSHGQATPPGEWYDQDAHEWVILLRGAAGLRVEGEEQVRELRAGDYVHLPAHLRHRVEWTAAGEATVWLAVHYGIAAAKS
jgi:cupin 2 domain-containing protein